MADFTAEKFEVFKLSDHIFKVRPFDGVYLEVEDILIMRDVFKELSKGSVFGVIIDGSSHFTASPEMREKTASKEFSPNRYGTALVTNKLANKLFGNFFLSFNKPESPTKIFSNEKDAMKWLEELGKQFGIDPTSVHL